MPSDIMIYITKTITIFLFLKVLEKSAKTVMYISACLAFKKISWNRKLFLKNKGQKIRNLKCKKMACTHKK